MVNLVGKILKVFHDNNLFEEGVELVGSWCFQLYKIHLGAKDFPLRTQDIDFLIPNPFRGKEHSDFIKQIEELGFSVDFHKDGSLFFWNSELKIEFITPEKGRGSESVIRIKKLGINAIPLRFVNFLLEKPITIQDNGIKIRVPNPAHFCLHKLIIASRRAKTEKYMKDVQQAICTANIVNPQELRDVYVSLPSKWRKTAIKSLMNMRKDLVLYSEEIEKLLITLQNNTTRKV
jgi:hypothetical protein